MEKYTQIYGPMAGIVISGCCILKMFQDLFNNYTQRKKRVYEQRETEKLVKQVSPFYCYNFTEKSFCILDSYLCSGMWFKSFFVYFSCTNLVSQTRLLGPWGT